MRNGTYGDNYMITVVNMAIIILHITKAILLTDVDLVTKDAMTETNLIRVVQVGCTLRQSTAVVVWHTCYQGI